MNKLSSFTVNLPTIRATFRWCNRQRRQFIYIVTSWTARSSFSFLFAFAVGSIVNKWLNSTLVILISLLTFAALDILCARLAKRYGKKQPKAKRIPVYDSEFSALYQLATTGRIASGVFHDIANPLSCLMLSLEEISDQNVDHITIERARTAADRIHNSMTKIRQSPRPWQQSDTFAIHKMLTEVQDMLIHRIRRSKIKVKIVADERLSYKGDRHQLERVCINLVSNALDALAATRQKDKCITLRAKNTPEGILLSIADTGQGIPKHMIKHILKPFFTTKKNAQGSGLGLTVAQYIIEQEFKGKLSVASKEGCGTTVSILLPTKQPLLAGAKQSAYDTVKAGGKLWPSQFTAKST